MANFTITASYSNGFSWRISNLEYYWTSTYYVLTVLRDTAFPSGTVYNMASSPLGNPYEYNVLSDYHLYYPNTTPTSISNLNYVECWTPATASISFVPIIITVDDKYWGITGTGTVPQGTTTPMITWTPSSTRPSYFYWSNYGTAPTSSTTTYFVPKATAWNAMLYNIQQLYTYKGLGTFSYTSVSTGNYFTCANLRVAFNAINVLCGSTFGFTFADDSAPAIITQAGMLKIQTALNSVT